MADRSNIEWTDASWTPIRARAWEIQDDGSGKERLGWHCEHVSEGCRNCYAEKLNLRLGTGFEFKPGNLRGKPGYHGGGIDRPELFLDEKMILAPLRWKKPRMIFVCSMTDLFADFVKDEWLDRIFAVMALCPQHTFQVLTKRTARMRDYCSSDATLGRVLSLANAWLQSDGHCAVFHHPDGLGGIILPNVWLGVSCERQEEADERIPLLLETPAVVRFVSAEPLLAPVDLSSTALQRDRPDTMLPDWVIVGGESGPGARVNWVPNVRAIVKQCRRAGLYVFVKQLGTNIQDRNDAGFDGCGPTEWPEMDYARVEENPNGYIDEAQGAPARIRLKDRKGGDMAEWPEDLRVREMPRVAALRSPVVNQPSNEEAVVP